MEFLSFSLKDLHFSQDCFFITEGVRMFICMFFLFFFHLFYKFLFRKHLCEIQYCTEFLQEICSFCSSPSLYTLQSLQPGGGGEETKVCLAFSLSSRKISLSTSLSFLPLRLLLHDPYYLFAWRGRGGERKVNRPKGTQRERERR